MGNFLNIYHSAMYSILSQVLQRFHTKWIIKLINTVHIKALGPKLLKLLTN